MQLSNYNHKIKETVKFHEVDLLGVCNNAVYFNYFEDARIKYLQDLKKNYQIKEILEGDLFFIMAHNHCDYLLSATLDDELEVLTKVKTIKNTSFEIEHIVINSNTNDVIAKGGGILVHINKNSKKSVLLPESFYKAVLEYENEVEVIKDS
ncbi:MAG: thioesterase family protein [Melioribacteraceae bacterium]